MDVFAAGAAIFSYVSNLQNPFQAPVNSTCLPPATTADWAALNQTVGGRLYPGRPWTHHCFSTFDGEPKEQDAEACAHVQKNFFDHFARADAFGSYSVQSYESCIATSEQCELNWLNPADPVAYGEAKHCKQGSVPDYYVDVKGQDDVIAALQFVKERDVPLVIKNTGHDFKGRSSAPGSLALWTHNLNSLKHEPEFVPEDCPSQPAENAITVGAGAIWQHVYEFTASHGLDIAGGADQTVGAAGGWLQGGGHSPLSPVYGMGADRVLQYKVVTVDGVPRTVNACQNPDLFWALRGGGGGTFAVVLEATMEVFPAKSLRVASINWPIDRENVKAMLPMVLEKMTGLASQGWAGYFTPSLGNLILINPLLNFKEAQDTVQPLIDLSVSLGGVSNVTEYSNFLTWFNDYAVGKSGQQDPVGLPHAFVSRLIPEKNHRTTESRAELLDALMNAYDNSDFFQLHMTMPFGFKDTDIKETSVNPIWRSTLYQVILVNVWMYDSTLEDKKAAYAKSTKAINYLRDVTPDSGTYHNEADVHEPSHEAAFWGENYERLLEIKEKYDPTRILDCWHCVGWKGPSSPRFKCYI
ncbi:FAD-binding domain-containing protein [Agrocybe pediades]|nr:FAD-binding domain-containing protein [Agrocybe pediades]